MNKIFGYSLLCIGLSGFAFFIKYKGISIPLKELWFVLSIFIIIIGGYFLAKYKMQKLNRQRSHLNNSRATEIESLKRTGEKVRVTLENSEVRSRSYHQEIVNESIPSRKEMLDALYDDNRNHKTQEIQQTYIVFYKQYNDLTFKFISQPTTQNADTVRMYIDRHNGVDLYISRKNPATYYFDLPFV
jgi:hypothetical protein